MFAESSCEHLRFALVRSTVCVMSKKSYGVWQELRVIRERTGWSSAELSKASTISAPYLSQLENGDRWPNATVTKKLAVALKVPVSVLERPIEQKGAVA